MLKSRKMAPIKTSRRHIRVASMVITALSLWSHVLISTLTEKQLGKKPIDRRGKEGRNHDSKQRDKPRYDRPRREFPELPPSDDPVAIRKQVEFYFSDSNLAYDDYMNKLVGGADNNSVPIATITNFKRMRHFQPFSAVVSALKESETLNVVGEKEDHIQRKTAFVPPELDDEYNDPSMFKSIYAKGFGDEEPTTQMDIEKFFAPYGPVNMVRMRRKLPKRDFKGSVFVEFESKELQEKFLALEDKPEYEGKKLQIMSKEEYCKDKLDAIKSGRLQPERAHYYK
jgi:lupus La protein